MGTGWVALIGAAGAEEPLCRWEGVPWEQVATLRSPRGAPFAVAGSVGGPVAEVGLREDGDLWLTLTAEGITASGAISLAEDPVLHLTTPVDLGPAARLVRGGLVEVRGPAPDGVEVAAHRWALADQRPRRLPTAVVPCAALSPAHRWSTGSEAEALRLAGLPPAIDTTRLRAGTVALRDEAGRPLLRLRSEAGPEVPVLARDEAHWRVAAPHWTGLVRHGLVRVGDAEAPAPAPVADTAALASDPGRTLEVRRCDRPLPLFGRVGREVFQVGRVEAGVPFEVVAAADDHVDVDFPQAYLHPAEGAALWMPPFAGTCPAEPLRLPGLSELLDGLL